MPKFKNGDYVIFREGSYGGFRDTTAGKPYEIVMGDMYIDDAGVSLFVNGWRPELLAVDRILTREEAKAEFPHL